MIITQLTPGTGNFHCGACIRDLTLTKALRDLGHDARVMPLYLPLIADEIPQGVQPDNVHFGGVNAYLQQKSALFRHTPRFLDKLLDTPWLLRKAARRAGMTNANQLGEMTHSMLLGEDGHQHKEINKLADALAGVHRPDVLCLSNVLLIGMAKRLKQALGIPIVCTLQGEDTFLDDLPDPWRERCWQLIADNARHIDRFFPVSDYHSNLMRDKLGLDPAALTTLHNGIDLAPYQNHTRHEPDPPVIGYFARLCPAKGLHTLIDAFITLRTKHPDLKPKLHAAGAATPADEPFIEKQKQKLEKANLLTEATFSPNVKSEDKAKTLASFTLLCVPATYGESFGLYVIEANALGVPAVQPNHGAFPEVLAETAGGILYDPDTPTEPADSLAALLRDPQQRTQLSEAAIKNVAERFDARWMAKRFADTLETLCNQAST